MSAEDGGEPTTHTGDGSDATDADDGRLVNTGDGYERVGGSADETAADTPTEDAAEESGLGRAGWVLVAVVVVSFVLIPGVIYLRPTVPAELGLRFLAAMLVLPFLPALLLGITAVWSLAKGGE